MGPVGEQLISLDKDMKTILSDTTLNDDQKAQHYFQTLQKYTTTKDLMKEPTKQPPPPTTTTILDDIPPAQKKKAEKVFNWLERTGSDINWNQKGEVDGIPGSNISDLVNELSKSNKSKKQPKGFTAFAEKMKEGNLPKTLVANSTLWDRHFGDKMVEDDDIYTTPSGSRPTPSRPTPYSSPTPVTPKRPKQSLRKPSPSAMKWNNLRSSKY